MVNIMFFKGTQGELGIGMMDSTLDWPGLRQIYSDAAVMQSKIWTHVGVTFDNANGTFSSVQYTHNLAHMNDSLLIFVFFYRSFDLLPQRSCCCNTINNTY